MAAAYDKYSVTQYSVSSILGYIEAGDIAIPEIQRPFVWKVRSSPTSTHVFPPSFFILLIVCVYVSMYYFPLFRQSCLFSADVLQALVSEGVFLMYPWREMFTLSNSTFTVLFFSTF